MRAKIETQKGGGISRVDFRRLDISDAFAIHALSEMKSTSPKINLFWFNLVKFVRREAAKFQVGIRKEPPSRKELEKESEK